MTDKSLSEAEYDAITDAAAHWCMRLHAGDCTTAERQAFEQWHDAHPLHAFEYAAMLEIWDVADHLPRSEPAPVVARRQPRSRLRNYAVAAAICLVALPLAALTGWEAGWLPSSYNHYEAENSLRQVTLDDGSQVELNLGTELVYSNFKDQRRVTLKKGEAFFKVSHDAQHPFIVHAGDGQVRVTGTQFNVWKYEDHVRVMLADAGTGAIRIGGIYNINEVSNLVPSLPKVLPVYLTQNQDDNPVLNSIPRKTPKS
jgi:transmembrane sensor